MIIFVTVLAPLSRLVGMLYVLIRSHEAVPPRHLRRLFAWAEQLRPWSMIEVFVFGVFVAYVKLGDLVTIGLAAGVYALLALTFVLVWIDSRSTARRCGRGSTARSVLAPPASGPLVGCETCGLVSAPQSRHAALPALRQPSCTAQAEQHRADLGLGHRRRDPLHPGELLPGADGGAARRRAAEHDPRRRRGACDSAACTRSPRWCSSPASRCRC